MNYWLHPEAQDDPREAAEFYREKAGTTLSQSLLQELGIKAENARQLRHFFREV